MIKAQRMTGFLEILGGLISMLSDCCSFTLDAHAVVYDSSSVGAARQDGPALATHSSS